MAARSAARSPSPRIACSTGSASSSTCGRPFARRWRRRRAWRWSRSPPTSSTSRVGDRAAPRRQGLRRRRAALAGRSRQRRTGGRDLLGSERPLMVGGDGVFWSSAAAELAELAELTGIPVYARRAGQGALSEDHPLAVRGPWKKPFTGRADVVIAVGFRFWSGEKFGQPPTWNEAAPTCRSTHAGADRLASAGRGGDRRRPQAGAAPAQRGGGQARLDFRRPARHGSGKSRQVRAKFRPGGARARSARIAATCRSIPTGFARPGEVVDPDATW